ncbi:VOC family protein [Solibacillus sp. FSL H8-0538]|uniref:VOC family protein n=1 Tax=Solibacillus sp. FSL H8-0538 TaxID=2921400 RepID=UPI0030F9980E
MYKLDHIVHFVEQPEQAMAQLIEEGLHVVAGGKHEMWGTYNALCYFGTTYVELIGIYDEDLFTEAAKTNYTLHASHEKRKRASGLTRFALRTYAIEEDAEKFRAAGFDVIGPETYSRTRPDESVVRWQLLHIGHPDSKIEYPFFIQWEEDDATRLADMEERGIITPHPAGQIEIEEVSYIIDNFKPVKLMSTLCGVDMTVNIDKELNAEVATVHVEGGKLVFYRPLGEGDVWEALLEHGQGLYNIVLNGAEEEKIVYCEEANYVFLVVKKV